MCKILWARRLGKGGRGGQSGAPALGWSPTAGRSGRPYSDQQSATVGRQGRATAGREAVARQATAGRPSTWRPAVAGPSTAALGGRRPPVGRRPGAVACTGCDCGCCAIFFYLFFEKKGDIFFSFFSGLACSKGLDFLRGCVHSIPFFEVCPYTWKC
jgi:hypothetical protein